MKKALFWQFIIGCAIVLVGNFSSIETSAQTDTSLSCTDRSICTSSPKDLQLLLDFVRELMNTMKTVGTEGSYVGQYINPDRYAGNAFSPPQQGISSSVIVRNASQKAKFALASTAIFSSPVNFAGIKDVLGGLVLLSKDKIYLRDTKLVEALESQVSTKRYELGLGGGRYTKVNATNRAQMQAVIDKYIAAGLLSQGSIADGVLYNNVTSLLIATLSATKSLLYFDSTNQFMTGYFSRGGIDGIKISFASSFAPSLHAQYLCVRGPYAICDTQYNSFTDAISAMLSRIASSGTGASQTTKDSLNRLKQTFQSADQQTTSFQDREKELLHTMYGTTKNSKGIFAGSIKASLSGIVDDMQQLGSDVSRFRRASADDSQVQKQRIQDAQSQQNIVFPATTQGQEAFQHALSLYVQDIFTQQATDIQLAYLAQPNDVTLAFAVLGDQIFTIKNDILGSSDTEGSLIRNLSDAASLQCNTK